MDKIPCGCLFLLGEYECVWWISQSSSSWFSRGPTLTAAWWQDYSIANRSCFYFFLSLDIVSGSSQFSLTFASKNCSLLRTDLSIEKYLSPLLGWSLGNLSKHDGDVWRERHKTKGLISKTMTARAIQIFVHFFAVLCKTTTWNDQIQSFM